MNFLIRGAAIAALLHIHTRGRAGQTSGRRAGATAGADAYVAREVHLSAADAHRLHEAVDWSPEDGVLVFYGGMAGSTSMGALEFVRVDTPHGPIEVAVGFTPQGAVARRGRHQGDGRDEAMGARSRRGRVHGSVSRAQARWRGTGGKCRDRGPRRESGRLRGRRSRQRGGARSCVLRLVLQSCDAVGEEAWI